MGFLLDWLHFPTLEWYRSAGSLCPPTAVDRFQTPFLSLFTLESFQGYLYYTVLGVSYDFVASYFITRMSPLIIGGSRNKDYEITRILALFGWTPCIPNREGKAISSRRSRRKRRRRRHILWKKLSIHHFRKEKREEALSLSLSLSLSWRILYIRLDGV